MEDEGWDGSGGGGGGVVRYGDGNRYGDGDTNGTIEVVYEFGCDCKYKSARGNLILDIENGLCPLKEVDELDWNLGNIPKGIRGFGINVLFVLLACKLFEYCKYS